jgi:phosphoribosylformimino-5-aminoimidazole carboxamide ribotide isomerase
MRVLPVIDLMAERVVRGIAGRRHEYRSIESRLGCDATPARVAQAFTERLGLREAYVADLDAIAGSEPAWSIYQQLADQGLRLWIDAGVSDATRARRLAEFTVDGVPLAAVIAGLESLPTPATLRELLSIVGPERLVFSLDLHGRVPRVAAPAWQGFDAEQIARAALELGVRRMIVLDLARVGVGDGVGTEPLCRQLRTWDAQLEITAGGGVRHRGDLESLAQAGCNAVLVASALHDERITRDDLRQFSD